MQSIYVSGSPNVRTVAKSPQISNSSYFPAREKTKQIRCLWNVEETFVLKNEIRKFISKKGSNSFAFSNFVKIILDAWAKNVTLSALRFVRKRVRRRRLRNPKIRNI